MRTNGGALSMVARKIICTLNFMISTCLSVLKVFDKQLSVKEGPEVLSIVILTTQSKHLNLTRIDQ